MPNFMFRENFPTNHLPTGSTSEILEHLLTLHQSLLNSMSSGVIYLDRLGNIQSMNLAAKNFFKVSIQDCQGGSFNKLFTLFTEENQNPIQKPRVLDYLLSTTQDQPYIYGIQLSEGSDFLWISLKLISLGKPAKENPIQIGLLFDDITAQKKGQQKLENQEKKYLELFNTMTEAFAYHEVICGEEGKPKDYRFLNINPSFERLTGLSKETLIGRTVLEVMPQTESYWIEKFGNVALTGESLAYTNYSAALNRHYRVVAYQPRKNYFAVLFTDVSELKNIEKNLYIEKELLAVTLQSIGDGVITTDVHGNIMLMNTVAENLTGWTKSEAEGQNIKKILHITNETSGEVCENLIEKVLDTNVIVEWSFHSILTSRDESTLTISISGAPIRDSNNLTIGVVIIFRDRTEKQKLLDISHNAQKLQSLGILAGGIAHDFNNLLGGIYGYIDLCLETLSEPRSIRLLKKASSTIHRAQALTQQLLTFAKGGEPDAKVQELFPMITEAVEFALSGSNVSFELQVESNLWPCKIDKNQITQVIDNIVINAKQAMPSGGSVLIKASNLNLPPKNHPILTQQKYVQLCIEDNGPGIPRELQCKIFDPFFTTKPKGHGLGLATCYSIIKQHQGFIDVFSELGKGTTFILYLPAGEFPILSEEYLPPSSQPGKGTILVLDDEECIRESLTLSLQLLGYEALAFETGEDLVNYYSTDNHAEGIIGMLFDLTIPGGMGGVETLSEIRKINPQLPIFVSSGYADIPVMKNPTDYGFTASIGKPFQRHDLVNMFSIYFQ